MKAEIKVKFPKLPEIKKPGFYVYISSSSRGEKYCHEQQYVFPIPSPIMIETAKAACEKFCAMVSTAELMKWHEVGLYDDKMYECDYWDKQEFPEEYLPKEVAAYIESNCEPFQFDFEDRSGSINFIVESYGVKYVGFDNTECDCEVEVEA